MKVEGVSCPVVFSSATPWPVARQASLSMGFSRQEYWSGRPCRSPADLPDPGIKHGSPTPWADSLPFELPGKPKPEYRSSPSEAQSPLVSRYLATCLP